MNDERFFNNPLFNVLPEGTQHYMMALTVKYHESAECREKIALSPLQCYATFPLNDVGSYYDRLRMEVIYILEENIQQWKYGDWALGVPISNTVNDTFKILKDYEKYVIKEKMR